MIMIPRCAPLLLFLLPVISILGNSTPARFDPSDVYVAMASSNIQEIDSALGELEKTSLPGKLAYEGAMLMKKSGLLSKPKEKLKVFKSGREKLETAIRDDSANVEYHFLRLIIQENAPKIVGYKKNIDADSKMVMASYNTLPTFLRQAIKNYSKTSKVLKTANF